MVLDFWFVLVSGFIFWIGCSLSFGFVLAFNLCVCVHFDFAICFVVSIGVGFVVLPVVCADVFVVELGLRFLCDCLVREFLVFGVDFWWVSCG